MTENQREIPLSDLEAILATERSRINADVTGHPRMNWGARGAIDKIAELVEEKFDVFLTIGRDSEIARDASIPSTTTRQTPHQ